MSDKQRILVVDDEPQITRVLRRGLMTHGYDVSVAQDGRSALQLFADWLPDLVVTDLSMPNLDGLELCRKLRSFSQLPIIVLSVRGEERTKVEALDAGADDYVTKPFGIDELLARIRAALRRAPAQDADDSTPHLIEAGDFRVNLETRVVNVQGREVHLTPKEYELLVYLVRHHGKVLTHHTLLGAVWGGDSVEQTEYLRVFIGQLRKKIEPDPDQPTYIRTLRGVGYRLEAPEDVA